MRALASLHRWWGVAFCLLFAMWFASGIVMHFVPFPARNEQGLPDGLKLSSARAEPIDYDQWTVAGSFDADRPLMRLAVRDAIGTEIYLSGRSGKVVLITTSQERALNYVGSIAHWFYYTELRHRARLWEHLLWWLSLVATLGVALGILVGIMRLAATRSHGRLRRAHHVSGLIVGPIVLAWIFSGFLSMNDGLFDGGAELFRALHKLELPLIASRPQLRSCLIVGLCLCGFAFSVTGVELARRRLKRSPTDAGCTGRQ